MSSIACFILLSKCKAKQRPTAIRVTVFLSSADDRNMRITEYIQHILRLIDRPLRASPLKFTVSISCKTLLKGEVERVDGMKNQAREEADLMGVSFVRWSRSQRLRTTPGCISSSLSKSSSQSLRWISTPLFDVSKGGGGSLIFASLRSCPCESGPADAAWTSKRLPSSAVRARTSWTTFTTDGRWRRRFEQQRPEFR